MLVRIESGYRSELLSALGVPHLFTTRPLDVGELDQTLARTLRRACGVRGPVPILAPRQVHGGTVIAVDGRTDARALAATPADGLWTEGPEDPGALLLVRTADCVPVLLASGDGRRVAAVHAGWRGVLAGVVAHALAAFEVAGARAVAVIGPCISTERFEVGPEVAQAFRDADLAAAVHERPGARPRVDLRRAIALQLERGRVEQVECSMLCTWESDDQFWSHRRDVTHGGRARTGRLGALIAPAGT
jgi:YfiH family protein